MHAPAAHRSPPGCAPSRTTTPRSRRPVCVDGVQAVVCVQAKACCMRPALPRALAAPQCSPTQPVTPYAPPTSLEKYAPTSRKGTARRGGQWASAGSWLAGAAAPQHWHAGTCRPRRHMQACCTPGSAGGRRRACQHAPPPAPTICGCALEERVVHGVQHAHGACPDAAAQQGGMWAVHNVPTSHRALTGDRILAPRLITCSPQGCLGAQVAVQLCSSAGPLNCQRRRARTLPPRLVGAPKQCVAATSRLWPAGAAHQRPLGH